MNTEPMSANRYAKHKGVDEKQVRRWIADGLPHDRTGRKYLIDTDLADQWVEQNAQPKDDQSSERQRLIREQADRVALANEVQRGKLLRLDHVTNIMTSAIANLTSQLDGVAGRLANELAGEKNPAVIRQAILNEHHRIRTAYADQLMQIFENPTVTEIVKPKAKPKTKAKAKVKRAKKA